MLGDALIESSATRQQHIYPAPTIFTLREFIMYIELREKSGKHYVMVRHDDSKDKPMAQFVSNNPVEAYNVARQYAKQNKCLIRATKGGTETPELPPQPAGEG